MAQDFWRPFEEYARAQNGRRSTFFLVPFKGRPGVAPGGTVEASRAVPYELSELREDVQQASASGHELAVHGIDAWRDADSGRAEMTELTSLTGQKTAGVRMHWLYFAEGSARHLENAGFSYDSTWGYNDAVGYRAGTSQVFRLPGSQSLMELPLSIMDSALFYSRRMGLSRGQALDLCRQIVEHARHFGGTLVINWHGRSLAPERLWGRFYCDLLAEIEEGDRVWFATAEETVRWFQRRRSIRFSEERSSSGSAIVVSAGCPGTPASLVRTYRPTGIDDTAVQDRLFDGRQEMRLSFEA